MNLNVPFVSRINPHAEQAQRESVEWALRFDLIPEPGRSALDAARLGWLEARVFHSAAPEILQLAADWVTWFCAMDDCIEGDRRELPVVAVDVLRLTLTFTHAVDIAPGPLGRALLDLRRRMSALASEQWVGRFAQRLEEVLQGFLEERRNQCANRRLTVSEYRELRAVTIGLRPQLLFGELVHGELPERVRNDHGIQLVERHAAQAIGWANDIFTYEKELAGDELHNLVFVLMAAQSLPLNEGVACAIDLHDAEVRAFSARQAYLPSFGPHESIARKHIQMLRDAMRGHLDWARETGRYVESRCAAPKPILFATQTQPQNAAM